jgi:hypothetical protein
LIVEIKAENERGDPINGEMGRKAMALRRWEELNPDRLQYEMIFTAADVVAPDQTKKVQEFLQETVHGA